MGEPVRQRAFERFFTTKSPAGVPVSACRRPTGLSDSMTARWRWIPPWGHTGYFADPDGHPWQVAHVPSLKLRDGMLSGE